MKNILLVALLSVSFFSNAAHFYIPDGDVAALKSAITASNTNLQSDTIHLYPYSRYILTTADNVFVFGGTALPRIALDGTLDNSLTILGNGAKLIEAPTGPDPFRIMYLESCSLKVYDLGFINGVADDSEPGGAILMNPSIAQVDLVNCLFEGNSAEKGGAIYVSNGNLNITNCTFKNNTASWLGSAIDNFAGVIYIYNSVIVNNYSGNGTPQGAIHNLYAIHTPASGYILIMNSIVALNTVQDPVSANYGLEFDLAAGGAIYSMGSNFIGMYDNSTAGNPIAFTSGLPSSNNDYVGTSSAVIDPMLGTFQRHKYYQETYSIQAGSLALNNNAGLTANNLPMIASYGIFPANGEEGDEITIYGKNLSNIYLVRFAGAADITSGITTTDTSITVTVPVDAVSGKITIYNTMAVPATSFQTFTIGPIVSNVDDPNSTDDFSFYPNPVSDYLTVNARGENFSVCDLYGRELMTSEEERIDVSELTEGVYVVKCGGEVRRFVKK